VTPDAGGAHVPDVLLGPASAPAGSLRARNLPTARWDPATRTCSGVYCHSSGQDPAGVTSLDYAATPPWDAAAGTLGCGGCHGNPPRYASSVPSGSTARANGHLDLDDEFTGGWETGHFAGMSGPTHGSKHGGDNPKFRFNDPQQAASPITCQACHFDTVAEAPGQFFFFDPTGSYSFTAAERPFVDPSRTAVPEWAWSQCVTCHAGETRRGNVLPLRHVNGRRDVAFDRRAALPAGYPTGLPPLAGGPVRPYYVTNFTPTVGFEPNPQFRLLPDSELVAVANTTVVSLVFHTTLESARYDPATKTCSSVGCHVGRKSLEDAGYVGPLQWGQPFQWYSPTNPLCIGCHNYGAPLP
jgi:predicted CxxxxCH...CXXCH cytochrome family protein